MVLASRLSSAGPKPNIEPSTSNFGPVPAFPRRLASPRLASRARRRTAGFLLYHDLSDVYVLEECVSLCSPPVPSRC